MKHKCLAKKNLTGHLAPNKVFIASPRIQVTVSDGILSMTTLSHTDNGSDELILHLILLKTLSSKVLANSQKPTESLYKGLPTKARLRKSFVF